MKKELIDRAQLKVMPWKNGGGVTAEIAIDPPGSQFEEGSFEWRLSTARIEEEGAFSTFPGYDRILTVLSGHGLLLNNQELGPFEIFEFEGEDQIHCSLIENAVEDLGLIYRRGRYRASFQILDVSARMYLKLEPGLYFFLSLSLPARVDGTELKPAQFLRLEDASSVNVEAENFPVHLLKIGIHPAEASG